MSAGYRISADAIHRSMRVALVIGTLTATVSAQDRVISDSEALRQFAPELTSAEVGFPSTEAQQEPASSRTPGLAYRFVQDLDGDGRPELALLGHGIATNDLARTFVLIISQPRAGGWERSKLFTFDKPYVVGESRPTGINVFFCEHCDSGGRVTWDGSDYRFDPF